MNFMSETTKNGITYSICAHAKLCQNVKKYPFSYQNPAMLLEKPKFLLHQSICMKKNIILQ